jgi:hypothetical protein|eukprot:COSAG06_NODE_2485_length_6786_cov_3.510244_5_plen_140_part_00
MQGDFKLLLVGAHGGMQTVDTGIHSQRQPPQGFTPAVPDAFPAGVNITVNGPTVGMDNTLFEPFYAKKRSLYQDRLGTNMGKDEKKGVFVFCRPTQSPCVALQRHQRPARNDKHCVSVPCLSWQMFEPAAAAWQASHVL